MDSKARLTTSMPLYSQRCDYLGVSSIGGCSSLFPEEVRDSEARLTASMHLYSQLCDNFGVRSIGGCSSLLPEGEGEEQQGQAHRQHAPLQQAL